MAKFGINDILNAKTKAAGQQAQTDGYKEIYLSPYVVYVLSVKPALMMHYLCGLPAAFTNIIL